jgi:hypothetical protein
VVFHRGLFSGYSCSVRLFQPNRKAANVFQSTEEAPEYRAENSLVDFIQSPWTGDLEEMLEWGLIRIPVVPTETSCFLKKGKPGGIAAEFFSVSRHA